MSQRNWASCEGGTRESLAFVLGSLSSISSQHGADVEPIREIEVHLIYPSEHSLALEMEYLGLNDEVNAVLLRAVDNQPFDLLRTLRKNRMLNDK